MDRFPVYVRMLLIRFKSCLHISETLEYPLRQIKVPHGQEEISFLKVLGETFPQMYPNVEAFKIDRRRRLIPRQLDSMCPAAIKSAESI